MAGHQRGKEIHDGAGINAGPKTQWNLDAAIAPAPRPVDQVTVKQPAIGDNEVGPGADANHAGANADLDDDAFQRVELDGVADRDVTLEREDESRDEVVDDRLEAEADSHRQGAANDRELPDIDTG